MRGRRIQEGGEETSQSHLPSNGENNRKGGEEMARAAPHKRPGNVWGPVLDAKVKPAQEAAAASLRLRGGG